MTVILLQGRFVTKCSIISTFEKKVFKASIWPFNFGKCNPTIVAISLKCNLRNNRLSEPFMSNY